MEHYIEHYDDLEVRAPEAREGALDHGLRIRPMVLPDIFQDHDTPAKMYEQAGLDARSIVTTALSAFGKDEESLLRPRRA